MAECECRIIAVDEELGHITREQTGLGSLEDDYWRPNAPSAFISRERSLNSKPRKRRKSFFRSSSQKNKGPDCVLLVTDEPDLGTLTKLKKSWLCSLEAQWRDDTPIFIVLAASARTDENTEEYMFRYSPLRSEDYHNQDALKMTLDRMADQTLIDGESVQDKVLNSMSHTISMGKLRDVVAVNYVLDKAYSLDSSNENEAEIRQQLESYITFPYASCVQIASFLAIYHHIDKPKLLRKWRLVDLMTQSKIKNEFGHLPSSSTIISRIQELAAKRFGELPACTQNEYSKLFCNNMSKESRIMRRKLLFAFSLEANFSLRKYEENRETFMESLAMENHLVLQWYNCKGEELWNKRRKQKSVKKKIKEFGKHANPWKKRGKALKRGPCTPETLARVYIEVQANCAKKRIKECQETYKAQTTSLLHYFGICLDGIRGEGGTQGDFSKYRKDLADAHSSIESRFYSKTQLSTNLEQLYDHAHLIRRRFEKFIDEIARDYSDSTRWIMGPEKKRLRTLVKAVLSSNGRSDSVCDIIRGQIVEKKMTGMRQALFSVLACDKFEKTRLDATGNVREPPSQSRIVIVQVKDRLTNPTPSGWADTMFKFYFEDDPHKHICELQLVHSEMMEVKPKEDIHCSYDAARTAAELLEYIGEPLPPIRRDTQPPAPPPRNYVTSPLPTPHCECASTIHRLESKIDAIYKLLQQHQYTVLPHQSNSMDNPNYESIAQPSTANHLHYEEPLGGRRLPLTSRSDIEESFYEYIQPERIGSEYNAPTPLHSVPRGADQSQTLYSPSSLPESTESYSSAGSDVGFGHTRHIINQYADLSSEKHLYSTLELQEMMHPPHGQPSTSLYHIASRSVDTNVSDESGTPATSQYHIASRFIETSTSQTAEAENTPQRTQLENVTLPSAVRSRANSNGFPCRRFKINAFSMHHCRQCGFPREQHTTIERRAFASLQLENTNQDQTAGCELMPSTRSRSVRRSALAPIQGSAGNASSTRNRYRMSVL
eukprot:m.50639 g.50639  ORF g.50639 m.50639 type:complete len:1001 (+) comp10683_c0_seq1:176-3178(+)